MTMSYPHLTVSIRPIHTSNHRENLTYYGHWDKINSQVPCPISFTDEELETHYRDGDGWNEQADFGTRWTGWCIATDGP